MGNLSKCIEAKKEVQETAVSLFHENINLLLEWCTGMGKGKAVLDCINSDESGVPWYIVVPEILQIENFKSEISKWGYDNLWGNKIADIICYASFSSLQGRKCNLVFNEVHRLSELKADIATTVKYNRIIADSATVPKAVKERLLSLGDFFTYRITLSRAKLIGALPEPLITIINVEPDDTKKVFRTEDKLKRRVTEKGYIDSIKDTIAYWARRRRELIQLKKPYFFIKNKIVRLGAIRKKAIAEAKTPYVKEILKGKLLNRRTIVFCGSVEQCDEIDPKLSVHYKKSKKQNIETLENFNNHKTNKFITNKIGREGINFSDIEVVVIVQLSSGRDEGLEMIQEIGRALRAESPHIVIMCLKGTKDVDFLESNLKFIDNKTLIESVDLDAI